MGEGCKTLHLHVNQVLLRLWMPLLPQIHTNWAVRGPTHTPLNLAASAEVQQHKQALHPPPGNGLGEGGVPAPSTMVVVVVVVVVRAASPCAQRNPEQH